MTEPKIHDRVQYGYQNLTIDGFDDDYGTRLSGNHWICASHLVSTGDNEWLYIPGDVEDMTVDELRQEHRRSVRNVFHEHVASILTAALLPKLTEMISEAAKEATEIAMRDVYRTPPRLMGKDTTKGS